MSIFREGILTGQGMIAIVCFAISFFCYKVSIRQNLQSYKMYAITFVCVGVIFFVVFMSQMSGILTDIHPIKL